MLFVNILAFAITPLQAIDPSQIFKIDIKAKGVDADISGATTFIKGKIEFDKVSGIPLAHVEFQTKIYDESGEKIYSMKGKLKDGLVISDSFQFYCEVREVLWIKLWFVMGEGVIKTTDADLEIEYRGETITLPNTEGQYLPVFIMVMINPKGEYYEFDPEDPNYPPGTPQNPVKAWEQGEIAIGGKTSAGLGWGKLRNTKIELV